MAGDWLKLEVATIDKPEVIAMADLLETSSEEVFGMLFRVWAWFDAQSRDGNAGSVTNVTLMKFVDRLVNRQGFAACMKKVGWLNDGGLPNFTRHNGESAKKRALTKDRAKRFRNANVTPDALPEKRREEKIKTIGANAFALPDWVPKEPWEGWIDFRKSKKYPTTDRALTLAVKDLAALRDQGHDPGQVLDTATLRGWRGLFAPGQQKPADLSGSQNPIYADMGLR